MSTLTFSEAFAKYDAKLANPMWAFSAKATDGSIVLSCWSHKFNSPAKGVMRYADRLSRWRVNTPGKNLLISHISEAYASGLPVRLIIATTRDPAVVDAGDDASKIAKTFHVREDLVGRVTSFDGDNYVIDFSRSNAA
jgi:hypothetical protein